MNHVFIVTNAHECKECNCMDPNYFQTIFISLTSWEYICIEIKEMSKILTLNLLVSFLNNETKV